jgi:hypothetical protein
LILVLGILSISIVLLNQKAELCDQTFVLANSSRRN